MLNFIRKQYCSPESQPVFRLTSMQFYKLGRSIRGLTWAIYSSNSHFWPFSSSQGSGRLASMGCTSRLPCQLGTWRYCQEETECLRIELAALPASGHTVATSLTHICSLGPAPCFHSSPQGLLLVLWVTSFSPGYLYTQCLI